MFFLIIINSDMLEECYCDCPLLWSRADISNVFRTYDSNLFLFLWTKQRKCQSGLKKLIISLFSYCSNCCKRSNAVKNKVSIWIRRLYPAFFPTRPNSSLTILLCWLKVLFFLFFLVLPVLYDTVWIVRPLKVWWRCQNKCPVCVVVEEACCHRSVLTQICFRSDR